MKKFFQFTTFKQRLKPFLMLMILFTVTQKYSTLSKIVVKDFIVIASFFVLCLIIDWYKLKYPDMRAEK